MNSVELLKIQTISTATEQLCSVAVDMVWIFLELTELYLPLELAF